MKYECIRILKYIIYVALCLYNYYYFSLLLVNVIYECFTNVDQYIADYHIHPGGAAIMFTAALGGPLFSLIMTSISIRWYKNYGRPTHKRFIISQLIIFVGLKIYEIVQYT